jgi:hypothetical protein
LLFAGLGSRGLADQSWYQRPGHAPGGPVLTDLDGQDLDHGHLLVARPDPHGAVRPDPERCPAPRGRARAPVRRCARILLGSRQAVVAGEPPDDYTAQLGQSPYRSRACRRTALGASPSRRLADSVQTGVESASPRWRCGIALPIALPAASAQPTHLTSANDPKTPTVASARRKCAPICAPTTGNQATRDNCQTLSELGKRSQPQPQSTRPLRRCSAL